MDLTVNNKTTNELEDKLYFYKARIVAVKDGDTVIAQVDYGFMGTLTLDLRLTADGFYFDAPEIHKSKSVNEAQKVHGKAAFERAKELLPIGSKVYIKTHKDDSFGRWLAELWLADGRYYPAIMVNEGFQKKDEYPDGR